MDQSGKKPKVETSTQEAVTGKIAFTECYKTFEKGVSPAELCWTLEEFKKHHVLHPYLCEFVGNGKDDVRVKPYFDFDMSIAMPDGQNMQTPSDKEVEGIYGYVTDQLLGLFEQHNKVRVIKAWREPARVKKNAKIGGEWVATYYYKISLRLFVVGAFTLRKDLKQNLANFMPRDINTAPEHIKSHNFGKSFFDCSVYDNGRKMNFVGKCKDKTDNRLLIFDPDEPIQNYMITVVDSGAVPLAWKNNPDLHSIVQHHKPKPGKPARTANSGFVTDIVESLSQNTTLLNDFFEIPTNALWAFEKMTKGLRGVPAVSTCVVNPAKVHSQPNHSCVFFNADRTIYKRCFSCGNVRVHPDAVSALYAKLQITLNINFEEDNSVYRALMEQVCMVAEDAGHRREEETGVVFRRINGATYAYERWLEPRAFLRHLFDADPKLLNSNTVNIDKLDKFLKELPDKRFPWMRVDRDYYGFQNGVLNIKDCLFTSTEQVPGNIAVRKYFDIKYTGETETPIFDTLLDCQFDLKVKEFLFMAIGRLLGQQDNWGFMIYLMGESGCGKSSVLDIVRSLFTNVASLSSNFEQQFGLSGWYKKDVVLCDDLPRNLAQILNQSIFQSLVTQGEVSIVTKGKTPFSVMWDVPLMWAGNYDMNYVDKGQSSRRIMQWTFQQIPKKADPTIKSRVLKEEIGALLLKCCRAYKTAFDTHESSEVWSFCPQYFLEQRHELRMRKNPLYEFLVNRCEYSLGAEVEMAVVKSAFLACNHSKMVGSAGLDHGSFNQANTEYIITKKTICKDCRSPHKANPRCCSRYGRNNKTQIHIVHNMKINMPTVLPNLTTSVSL